MPDNEGYSAYFEDALRIHAICADSSLDEDEARLLTYMHTKACETGKGIDYFLSPAEEDAEALEIMLGKSSSYMKFPSSMNLDERGQEALELIMTIADKISNLDHLLAKECGLENRLTGELRARLRLYKDAPFRNKMVELYKSEVIPKLSLYDKEKIDKAFSRFREEQQRKELELMEMVGLKKEN